MALIGVTHRVRVARPRWAAYRRSGHHDIRLIDRDGAWINPERRFWRDGPPWTHLYYVDPRDGLLKESAKLWKRLGIDPKPWKRKPASDPNVRVLEKMRELRRIDGIWYELVFVHEPSRLKEEWEFDLLARTHVRADTRRGVAKRQLAHDELLAHGLANSNN